MIKIDKDLSGIPNSLKLPLPTFFPGKIPSPPITTHIRRMEIINQSQFIDKAIYSDRYKQHDIKAAIKKIYNNKCAYCEQWIEQSHIEHYRPKTIYYWLAFSWDNLILACPTCNQQKGINFELRGTRVNFVNIPTNIDRIHSSSAEYDIQEQPKMVNPEVIDPKNFIRFQKNGIIESDDVRFAYTIDKCKIDRPDLNDQRRTLLNKFKEDIRSVLIENAEPDDQKIGIRTIVSKFVRDSKDLSSTFLAFKRFAISSDWLGDLIKEMN
jgi:uncharacterized protein (TIGR02646 family)